MTKEHRSTNPDYRKNYDEMKWDKDKKRKKND